VCAHVGAIKDRSLKLNLSDINKSETGPGKNRPMNKNDISKKVYEIHGGMSYVEAQRTVDLILNIIKSRLARGEKVLITGFGCFRIVKRKDKKGVNPQTGEAIIIPGRKSVKFIPSKYLKSI